MEGARKMKVESKYSIKFPFGSTVVMTLKSIHPATVPHDVKYIFKDGSGTTIKLTKGVCNRVIIRKYLETLIYEDDLYY
jgi:hypothetical protein